MFYRHAEFPCPIALFSHFGCLGSLSVFRMDMLSPQNLRSSLFPFSQSKDPCILERLKESGLASQKSLTSILQYILKVRLNSQGQLLNLKKTRYNRRCIKTKYKSLAITNTFLFDSSIITGSEYPV